MNKFGDVLDLIKLVLCVIFPFALFVILDLFIDNIYRKKCEYQNGTYIQENMGLGKGYCMLRGKDE